MKSMMKSILVVGVAVLAALSMAQGGGAGGGGGRGQGRGQFGRGGFADPSGINLLQREDVQGELKLTADQKTKLQAIQEDQRTKGREAFQNFQSMSQEERTAAMTKMQAENQKAVFAVIDDSQKKRLKELAMQRMGNSAATNADVQKDLGVTDDQKTKIKDLQAKQQEANTAVFQKMRDGEIQREELQGIMQKNQETFNTELGKILTEAQKQKIKDMGGKPFKFVEQQPGG